MFLFFKNSKVLAIVVISSLVLLFLSVGYIFNLIPYCTPVIGKGSYLVKLITKSNRENRNTEARLQLMALFSLQIDYKSKFSKFYAGSDFSKIGYLPHSPAYYKIGYMTDFDEEVAKYCRDCLPTDSTFKLMAVAKLSDDNYEVWTIDHEKELKRVSSGDYCECSKKSNHSCPKRIYRP